MYSNIKSVQLLISMLKERKIKNLVLAAGTTHDAIIRSAEEDGYFNTYSIVDERSAAFFALGLIQELEEPVAVVCTSGTAASNFLSGVTEAYYRKLPLLVITADKNHYYLNQRDDQIVPQMEIFNGVIKYKVDLPMVENDKDYWYCERLLNEAFLELDHHGKGPVQINVPIDYGVFAIDNTFTTEKLPKINVVKRIIANSSEEKWKEKKEELKKYSKIILIYGQNNPISAEEKQKVDKFASKYNCIIASEKISNFSNEYSLDTGAVCRILSKEQMNKLAPELVIVLNGNYVSTLKGKLKAISKNFKSWLVSEEGMLQDQFENLSNIFECKTSEFLDKITTEEDIKNNKIYLNEWKNVIDKFKVPKLKYSNLYAMRELFENIPENSILNLSNSLTPRNASLFELKNKIPVYCNRGVNGIDGSMSTFIGQSYVTDKLSFLVIGDLSFFYDMNALWNRYLKRNLRIMLNNNQGAALLHFTTGTKKIPTLNNAIAAEHFSTAKGWVESQGFEYLCSHNKEEFDKNLKEFIRTDSNKPIFFEVFTDKAKDAEILHNVYDENKSTDEKLKKQIKQSIKKIIGR